jgi:hypothetical protein
VLARKSDTKGLQFGMQSSRRVFPLHHCTFSVCCGNASSFLFASQACAFAIRLHPVSAPSRRVQLSPSGQLPPPTPDAHLVDRESIFARFPFPIPSSVRCVSVRLHNRHLFNVTASNRFAFVESSTLDR